DARALPDAAAPPGGLRRPAGDRARPAGLGAAGRGGPEPADGAAPAGAPRRAGRRRHLVLRPRSDVREPLRGGTEERTGARPSPARPAERGGLRWSFPSSPRSSPRPRWG